MPFVAIKVPAVVPEFAPELNCGERLNPNLVLPGDVTKTEML